MTWEMVLPFPTDDAGFIMGFEAGRVWEMFKDDEPFEQMVHGCNSEIFLRMGEAVGRAVAARILDDTWMLLEVA